MRPFFKDLIFISRNKRRKSLKDLTANSHYNDTLIEDYDEDEKFNLCLKTYEVMAHNSSACQSPEHFARHFAIHLNYPHWFLSFSLKYLSQINKSKTNTFNQLYLCLFNYYKFQRGYAEETTRYLNEFLEIENDLAIDQNLNDIIFDNNNINNNFGYIQNPLSSSTTKYKSRDSPGLVDFNFNQSSEKQIIDEKLKLFRLRKMNRNRAISTPFLSEISIVKYLCLTFYFLFK